MSNIRSKYKVQIRAHEFVERQAVSLLDLESITKNKVIALWDIGVKTAQAILEADANELAKQLSEHEKTRFKDVAAWTSVVQSWQKQIADLWLQKTGKLPERTAPREPGTGRMPRLF